MRFFEIESQHKNDLFERFCGALLPMERGFQALWGEGGVALSAWWTMLRSPT
jgi:hypothetical protein